MPSGKVHHEYWRKFIWLALAYAVVCALVSIPLGLGYIFGYLLGRYIDPDLDHRNTTSSEYRAMRELGLLGVLLVAYWMPYGFLISHRSPLSHWPFLSTAIRFVYMFWWLFWLFSYFDIWNNTMLFSTLGVYLGLVLADGIHWALDVFYDR